VHCRNCQDADGRNLRRLLVGAFGVGPRDQQLTNKVVVASMCSLVVDITISRKINTLECPRMLAAF
jgi:hypothetical protein